MSNSLPRGVIDAYIEGGRGVLIELSSETDFVTWNPKFKTLVRNVAEVALESNAATVEELSEEKWPGDHEGRTVAGIISSKFGLMGAQIALRRFARYEAVGNHVVASY